MIDVSKSLARSGHRVLILGPGCPKKPLGPIEFLGWRMLRLGRFSLLNPFRLPLFIKMARRASLVYFMDVGNPLLPLLSSIARLGEGVVVGLHGGLGALLSKARPSHLLLAAAIAYSRLASALGVWFHSINKVQHKRAAGLKRLNVGYSPLTIDCSHLGGVEASGGGRFRVLTVSRYEPRAKGHDLLVEVVKTVADLEPGVGFVLVGRGLDRLPINRLSNLEYLGFIPNRRRLARVYSSSSLYLSTSRWETFGITLAEALVSGLPCVTTPIPLALEHVRGGAGVVARRPEEIVDAIIRYYEAWRRDKDGYARLRRRISERYRRVFCGGQGLLGLNVKYPGVESRRPGG